MKNVCIFASVIERQLTSNIKVSDAAGRMLKQYKGGCPQQSTAAIHASVTAGMAELF